jgi:hypothetical protein
MSPWDKYRLSTIMAIAIKGQLTKNMKSKVQESFDFVVDASARVNFGKMSLRTEKFNTAMERGMSETLKHSKDTARVSIITTTVK